MGAGVRFTGHRLECVTVIGGAPYTQDTDISQYDGTYSDCCLVTDFGSGIARIGCVDDSFAPVAVEAGATHWFHAQLWYDYFGGAGTGPVWRDSALTAWIELRGDGTGGITLWANSGSGFAQLGGSIATVTRDNPTPIDVALTIDPAGAAHTVVVYYGNTVTTAGGSFAAAGLTDIEYVDLAQLDTARATCWSEVMMSEDISTVSYRVFTIRGASAGTYQEWTGDVSQVNKIPGNISDANTAETTGLAQTYEMSNIGDPPAGFTIQGVWVWESTQNRGGTITNILPMCRTGGTDEVGADLPDVGLAPAFGSSGARYDVNPKTSAPWTQTEVNEPVQFGYKSAA